MALVQAQSVSLPKLKTKNNQKIPIVQHLIKDEDISPPEVKKIQNLTQFSY